MRCWRRSAAKPGAGAGSAGAFWPASPAWLSQPWRCGGSGPHPRRQPRGAAVLVHAVTHGDQEVPYTLMALPDGLTMVVVRTAP